MKVNIGDTLYQVNIGAKEPIIEMRILQIMVEQASYMQKTFTRIDTINENDMGENSFLLEEIGKTVFLSRSEAAAKLKERVWCATCRAKDDCDMKESFLGSDDDSCEEYA